MLREGVVEISTRLRSLKLQLTSFKPYLNDFDLELHSPLLLNILPSSTYQMGDIPLDHVLLITLIPGKGGQLHVEVSSCSNNIISATNMFVIGAIFSSSHSNGSAMIITITRVLTAIFFPRICSFVACIAFTRF